jgi:hypothetical protein
MVRDFETFICPAPRLGPFSKSACGKLETLSPEKVLDLTAFVIG